MRSLFLIVALAATFFVAAHCVEVVTQPERTVAYIVADFQGRSTNFTSMEECTNECKNDYSTCKARHSFTGGTDNRNCQLCLYNTNPSKWWNNGNSSDTKMWPVAEQDLMFPYQRCLDACAQVMKASIPTSDSDILSRDCLNFGCGSEDYCGTPSNLVGGAALIKASLVAVIAAALMTFLF
eukprot:TRINITY_DN122_c0_g1_i3.p1 TRINITY_DN122_c0_g1~~TRINITY_DN122_c0_g1_i3.p1  ORF type:complete len:181 (+),score=29.00 TRINITY_DN122_c0_g1_i3:186-728(+)